MNRNDFENLIEHGHVTTLDAALFDAARERALALRSAALRDTAHRLRRRLSASATLGGVAVLLVGGALVGGGLLLDRDGLHDRSNLLAPRFIAWRDVDAIDALSRGTRDGWLAITLGGRDAPVLIAASSLAIAFDRLSDALVDGHVAFGGTRDADRASPTDHRAAR